MVPRQQSNAKVFEVAMAAEHENEVTCAGSLTDPQPTGTASFEHLTGHSRGTATWLNGDKLALVVGRNRMLRVVAGEPAGSMAVAHLARDGDSYHLEAGAAGPVWINGRRAEQQLLAHGDLIEFGERGPVSRYSLFHERDVVHRNVADVLKDAAGYLRVSRKPLHVRILRACGQVLRRLARETTVMFRVGVVLVLCVLAALLYQQAKINRLLQSELERSAEQMESFSKSLARTRDEALTPGDLEALRQELNPSVSAHEQRLDELERRWEAGRRVIATSAPSVVFLQAAYGFQEAGSNRMLRHVVSKSGRPLLTPFGTPMLSLDGEGPVVERQLTGTGFVLAGSNRLLTNRHVALPWENDSQSKSLKQTGLRPVLIKFIGYYVGRPEPVGLSLVKASETSDLAIVRPAKDTPAMGVEGLRLAQTAPQPGDPVLILGYPTGLRSMVAQGGEAFIKRLQDAKISGFWAIAAKLAEEMRIRPLASRGIVGQITAETIVYDAETTHGGSGGPVLDKDGNVVAVNAAIVPKFGGSNIGVPAARVREFMALLDDTAG